jgi:protein required for attachment to host cells
MKDIVWALVMNATHARIIKGIAKGDTGHAPDLILNTVHKDLREVMSDKPGRSFSSVGQGRSSMEYASDPVKDARRAFVKQAVGLLHQHFVKHEFSHLAVFASPEMLGLIRESLTPDLTNAVIMEMPKNLLHETPHDLRQIVMEHVFTKE